MKGLRDLVGMATVNVLFGVWHRFIYSPEIYAMHNVRNQRLASPIVGVLKNAIPFSVWLTMLYSDDGFSRLSKKSKIFIIISMYIASFTWYGAGIIIGMLLGDTFPSLNRVEKRRNVGISRGSF